MTSPDSSATESDAPPWSEKKSARPEAAHADLSGRTVTINRPRDELYRFWRDLTNLPRFMENIESISVIDDTRSHWVVSAPGGKTVEWDSIITKDVPGRLIAWRSAEGADISNSGRIEFRDAPPGRGTEVTATIAYDPPAGTLGKLAAKLFQKEPRIQARRELRRFKQLMETGEISTSEPPKAAPRA
jgi:uncharacterized membrane protein